MKLPNGFGSVHKLSGKRRNPFRARITRGWSNDGKQIYSIIGYYHTKEEALTALANYNSNPYDLATDSITFAEVYQKWSEDHFTKIVPSAQRTWKCAYKYCSPLYNMRFKDIRVSHLEKTIMDADVGLSTKQRIKSLFNLIYKWALRHEICDKNYAQLCNSVEKAKPQIARIPFTYEEINLLWDNIDFPFVDMILISLYSGWRPQELALLKTENIDLENMIIKGGLKTDAGKNRIVPIHSKIQDLIRARYNSSNEYLFYDTLQNNYPINTYERYYGRFQKVMSKLNLKHMPHDTRHTFITEAKEKRMNEYILKLIVGHSIQDITEKVYTHRQISDLKEEIEKITYTQNGT